MDHVTLSLWRDLSINFYALDEDNIENDAMPTDTRNVSTRGCPAWSDSIKAVHTLEGLLKCFIWSVQGN